MDRMLSHEDLQLLAEIVIHMIQQQSSEEDGVETCSNPEDVYPGADSVGLLATPYSGRTTLMLRNIPNRFTRDELVKVISLKMGIAGSFDFFYLPTDFRSKCNFGYAFINLSRGVYVDKFFGLFNGVNLNGFVGDGGRDRKICQVTFARVQGLEANVRRLLNSPIMGAANVLGASQEEIDASMPILFDSVSGEPIPLPKPNAEVLHSIMHPRASASLANPPHKKPSYKRRITWQ